MVLHIKDFEMYWCLSTNTLEPFPTRHEHQQSRTTPQIANKVEDINDKKLMELKASVMTRMVCIEVQRQRVQE